MERKQLVEQMVIYMIVFNEMIHSYFKTNYWNKFSKVYSLGYIFSSS